MSYGRTRFGMGDTTNDLVYMFRVNYPELFEKRDPQASLSRGEKNIASLKQLDNLFDQLLLGK
jgi:hypothetical protein